MKSATYNINHITNYTYSSKIEYGINSLRLQPSNTCSQTIQCWDIIAPGNLLQDKDGFGNTCHHFTLFYPTDNLSITACGVITSYDCFTLPNNNGLHPSFYLQKFNQTIATPQMHEFALRATKNCKTIHEKALALMDAVYQYIAYVPKSTNSETTAGQAYTLRQGVCQDQAHVYLACARSINMACRYVSGYLFSEFVELSSHAWVDVAINDNEWISLDITHNRYTNEKYVRLAVGSQYQAIAPIKGLQLGGEAESMNVDITIRECMV